MYHVFTAMNLTHANAIDAGIINTLLTSKNKNSARNSVNL